MKEELIISTLTKDDGHVYFELGYDPDTNLCLANWIGYLEVDEIKVGAELVLETIKNHEVRSFFNDNRQVEGTWDDANDWIATSWMPRAIEAGLRRFATVLSPDIYSQLSAEFMADNAEKTILQLKNFKSEEEACQWLLESELV